MKLYILFYDFLARLSETSRASQIAEQQKWLKKRKKLIHAGYAEYEGGTLAAYTAGQGFGLSQTSHNRLGETRIHSFEFVVDGIELRIL